MMTTEEWNDKPAGAGRPAMTANPFAALLAGVTRFNVKAGDHTDPSVLVLEAEVLAALAAAVPADLAEAGKVLERLSILSDTTSHRACGVITALLARIAAQEAAMKRGAMLLEATMTRAEAAETALAAMTKERDELERKVPRFPDHMAKIVEAKNAGLPERLQALVAALEAIPEYMRQYQWVADQKQAFGSKWVRAICGDNGKGVGRQAIAEVEGHIDVADFIAAANPDTVALMLTQIAALTARVEGLTGSAMWALNHVSYLPMDEATQSDFMRHRAAITGAGNE